MQTAQINLKLEPQTKIRAQTIAKKLGLSFSDVLRGLIDNFIVNQKIDFSFKKQKKMSSKTFIKEMIAAGYEKEYAKEHGRAYEGLLEAEKKGELIRVL
jgi:addiction module RelB/DinJ family antitoxin